jgi:hypothetical protein
LKGKRTKTDNPVVAESPPGVFLYLGYSKKDSIILTRGRMKIQDEKNIPSTDEEERKEVKNTIQQTVSHFTSNANKVTESLVFTTTKYLCSARLISWSG